MTNDTHYTKLSKTEAFGIIGLHQKDEKTYFLENFIITIEGNSLHITIIPGEQILGATTTTTTQQPFAFFHNDIQYLLKAENGILQVYKEEHPMKENLSIQKTS